MSFRKRVRQQRQKRKKLQSSTPSLSPTQRKVLSLGNFKRRSDQKNQNKITNKKQTPKTIETIVKVDLIEVKLNKKV